MYYSYSRYHFTWQMWCCWLLVSLTIKNENLTGQAEVPYSSQTKRFLSSGWIRTISPRNLFSHLPVSSHLFFQINSSNIFYKSIVGRGRFSKSFCWGRIWNVAMIWEWESPHCISVQRCQGTHESWEQLW